MSHGARQSPSNKDQDQDFRPTHGKELVMNEVVDHTLRNKMASDNEGGLCAGAGTVGSFTDNHLQHSD